MWRLFFAAATCVVVLGSSYEVCSEDAPEGTCWLQEGFKLGSRLVTEAASEVVGPLTEEIQPEDFPMFGIPLGWKVFAWTAVFVVLLVGHEACVASGAKPLLADHQRGNTVLLQVVIVLTGGVGFVSMSLLIPLSLDYSLAMGESATASGIFISGGAIFGVAGVVLGKPMTSETDWNQSFTRRLFLGSNFACFVGWFGIALLLQSANAWELPAKRRVFWLVLVANGALSFFQTLPLIAWTTMWQIITPNKERTFWMIMMQCCRNGGFVLGPVAFATLSVMVRQGREVSPISMMGWSFVGMAVVQAILLVIVALTCPVVLGDVEAAGQKAPEGKAPEEDEVREHLETAPEDLPCEAREEMVKHMIVYCYERPFTIAAIEVATMMLLEVSYGWSAELCGFSLMAVGGGSLILTAFSSLVLSRRWMLESGVFFSSTLVSLFGVPLLFDWKIFGAGGLLFADAVIYGGSSISNGIAQSWASRAAMTGTRYSIENYRVQNLSAVYLSRLLAPIVARFLVDFGGQNVYAAAQLLMCFLGTVTVYRTVCLIWEAPDLKRLMSKGPADPRKEAG